MDPNFTTWLSQRPDRGDHPRPKLERTVYRTQTDHLWLRLTTSARHQLGALLLAMGQRLSDEPLDDAPSVDTEPLARTP
jgi:hypothetical protein